MRPADYKRLAAIVGGTLLILVMLPHVLWAFRHVGGVASITVNFGTPFLYNSMYPPQTVLGDGWASTWADDDKIYATYDDCSVFSNTSPTGNMMLATLSATDSTVVGTTVNQMAAWGQPLNTLTGSPSRSHKWQGIISVSGVLYAINWRLDPNYTVVSAFNDGQLLKSTDHGATWSPTPPSTAQPYTSPMFPGLDFPFGFVQYGKDYTGNGPDNSGTYIYALVVVGSNFMPGGLYGSFKLARVPIAAIGNQLASDWQYWTGGDGMISGNWSSSVSAGASVLNSGDVAAGQAAYATSMQYLPRYQKYLFVGLSGPILYSWICNHPWGPCVMGPPSSNYGHNLSWPSIMPKSLVGGGQQLTVATSGDPSTCCGPTANYTLHYFPVTLSP